MGLSWKEYFRELAKTVSKKSKDRNAKIGAVIVGKGNEVISTGYNSFPRNLNDEVEERYERPEKFYWTEHAERNAIYNAARVGVPTDGCSIYLSHWFPCADCARAIINSGITKLYCDELNLDIPSKFNESFKRSIEMLLESGVEIIHYD